MPTPSALLNKYQQIENVTTGVQDDTRRLGQESVLGKVEVRRRGRPTKEDTIKLRERLIKVATRQFIKSGYHRTSLDTISTASKIGKMTIYRHFSNKEQLFRAVVARANERFRSRLSEIARIKGDPVTVLRSFAAAAYDGVPDDDMIGLTRVIMGEADIFPDLAYSLYQLRREMIRPLTEFLERMTKEGTFEIALPEMSAFHFVALASGGVRPFLVTRHAIARSRDVWIEETVKLFLHGVTRGGRLA